MNINKLIFNYASLEKIYGENRCAMIYGLKSCEYSDLLKKIKEASYLLTLDYSNVKELPFHYDEDKRNTTHELVRKCKATLTGLVLENMKRYANKEPLIPLIFFIGIENLDDPAENVSLNLKKIALNHSFSASELRRCYKLADHPDPTIATVAQKTFHFTKLVVRDGAASFEVIDPFYNKPEWKECLNERKLREKQESYPFNIFIKQHPWRKELAEEKKKIGNFYSITKSFK